MHCVTEISRKLLAPLFGTRRRIVLNGLLFASLLVLAFAYRIPQTVDTIGQGLSLSLFDARTPNPVPEVAPPVRILQNAPTLAPASNAADRVVRGLQPNTTLDGPASSSSELRAALSRWVAARARSSADAAGKVPVYNSLDLLTGYLTNLTYPIILDGKAWDFGSTNFTELNTPNGGTSYWDYWSEEIPWNSPNHGWQDESGQRHPYGTETIKDAAGQEATAYVLLARRGPGVMDKLWVTHDPTNSFMGVLLQSNIFFWTSDPPQVTEWGSLEKLGNLRIEVDGHIVYDGPVQDWFSGDAQSLTPDLRRLFVWHYRQLGSNGNIIPIPYQDHLKVWIYGGKGKPKWFMATGMTLPPGTRVQPYTGRADDLPQAQMEDLAQTILSPENFINAIGSSQHKGMDAEPGTPAVVTLTGSGTVAALQFRISKQYDPRQLALKVAYGGETGIDLPFLAFFGEPDQVLLHHSTPVGIMDLGDEYLFYSNLPMPFSSGMTIELAASGSGAIHVDTQLSTIQQVFSTQLRAVYQPPQKLAVFGPDFTVDAPGSGKMVGLVLSTSDQEFDQVPQMIDPKTGKEDNAKKTWPMGYLEGNLTITDSSGAARYYSGQEDWAEGGYYFNSGYTTPPGGANMPFAGILRYQGGRNGFATLFRYFNDLSAFRFKNGLHLAFGHGTWNNNYPARYAATVLYYGEIPGLAPEVLPASDYRLVDPSVGTNP